MISVRYLLCLLIICLPMFVNARCTDDRKHKLTSDISQTLCELAELRPDTCEEESESMKFVLPKTISKKDMHLVMQMSFRFALELFQKNSTPTNWNPEKLKQLRDLLGQQTPTAHSSSDESNQDLKKWTTLWTTLNVFLEDKGFSACAWENLRTVVLSVMFKIRKAHGLRIRAC